eukprot:COSAG03_NODE_2362_length_2845_cov_20.143481_3_plen_159_part_00
MGGAQAAAAPEAPEAPEAPPKKKAKAAPERGTGLGSRRALTSLDAWEREPLKHAWSLPDGMAYVGPADTDALRQRPLALRASIRPRPAAECAEHIGAVLPPLKLPATVAPRGGARQRSALHSARSLSGCPRSVLGLADPGVALRRGRWSGGRRPEFHR